MGWLQAIASTSTGRLATPAGRCVVTDDRDRQRHKVYAWEERFVAPREPSSIKFDQAQGMVDAIWTVADRLPLSHCF